MIKVGFSVVTIFVMFYVCIHVCLAKLVHDNLFCKFKGRPEKLPDVCYSWWVLASLKIIGKLHWINKVFSVFECLSAFCYLHLYNIPVSVLDGLVRKLGCLKYVHRAMLSMLWF